MAEVLLGPTSDTWSPTGNLSECRRTTILGSGRGTLVAPSSGTCTKMQVYNPSASAYSGQAGIYNAANELLVSASFSVGATPGWYDVEVSPTSIVSGSTYYSAIAVANKPIPYTAGSGSQREGIASTSVLPNPWSGFTQVSGFEVGVRLVYDDEIGSNTWYQKGDLWLRQKRGGSE